ncbi:MAG: LysM peptidoglycan-binding domain-containing protein [Actinomycetota bacterium]|nr:LysM peptidoglycan-binding domain-containing protein [Actinomycetota bacterium]
MAYEYEPEGDFGGRILWGRVAFIVVGALLMFLLGRCSASGGVPQSEVDEKNDQIEQLASENESLRQEVAALNAEGPRSPAGSDATEATDEEPTERRSPAAPKQGETYIVKSGDTLISIAEKVYDDRGKWRLIAQANGIDDTNGLRVGQELRIPPDE